MIELDGGASEIKCDDGTSATIPGGGGGSGGNGQKGDKGDKGDPGEDGQDGEKGDKGDKGDRGDQGSNAFAVAGGLKVTIDGVTIPEDLHPVVTLRITDGNDQPLDREGKLTPGAVSVSFVFAKLNSANGKVGEYAPYNVATVTGVAVDGGAGTPALDEAMQPRSEGGSATATTNVGTWTKLDANMGSYTYRMLNPVPGDYDKTKTHSMMIYSSRTFEDVAYASNPSFDLRPDGEAVTEHRQIVTTDGCNKCHGTLTAHGGSRRETKLCITCHVTGMNDPESGNSIAMTQMIHKIHTGSDLPSVLGNPMGTPPVPSVPYVIYGYMNTAYNFSKVTFPQPDTRNCVTCHTGPDADRWKTEFSKAVCGACHDRTWFGTMADMPLNAGWKLHNGGQQASDDDCKTCHAVGKGPIAGKITDVVEVHKELDELPTSPTMGGATTPPPKFEGKVLGVTGTGMGQTPAVTFQILVNDVARNVMTAPLPRLRFTFAGPTTDYACYKQFTAQTLSGSPPVQSSPDGVITAGTDADTYVWTSAVTMDAMATECNGSAMMTTGFSWSGSGAVGLEAQLKGYVVQPSGTSVQVTYNMHNPVYYFKITDTTVVPRREAVVVENCNNCHKDLSAHGGSRNDPEYCVLCHNANNDNPPNVPMGQSAVGESVRLSHMIHRIHTGEKGERPYAVWASGGGSTPKLYDFSDVLFPADRRNCTLCHVPKHYKLPLPDLLPSLYYEYMMTGAGVGTRQGSPIYMGATAAACTGCHDSEDAIAHAGIMSTTDDDGMPVESCGTCHGTGAAYDIDVVHAAPELAHPTATAAVEP